jgi:hypothetical protein
LNSVIVGYFAVSCISAGFQPILNSIKYNANHTYRQQQQQTDKFKKSQRLPHINMMYYLLRSMAISLLIARSVQFPSQLWVFEQILMVRAMDAAVLEGPQSQTRIFQVHSQQYRFGAPRLCLGISFVACKHLIRRNQRPFCFVNETKI